MNAVAHAPKRELTEREQQERKVSAMLELLPESVDGDRFKAFSLAVLRDPNLSKCSEQSKLLALADCAKLGLYPDKNLGHVWLVPFGGQVTLIPGYQGYIELARRSGAVRSVHADVVCENDSFRVWTDDNGRHLLHEPDVFSDRGKAVGVYCVATMTSGPPQIEVMSWEDVMKIRGRSKAKDSGPWKTDLMPMARKTVVRQARKYWPQSPELAALGSYDDELDGKIVDGHVVEPPKRISSLEQLSPQVEEPHAEDASQTEPDAQNPPHQRPSRESVKEKRKKELAHDGTVLPDEISGPVGEELFDNDYQESP